MHQVVNSEIAHTYFLTRVMAQLIGIHQSLPRSPSLSIILSSLGVASWASVRDWLEGNMAFRACTYISSSFCDAGHYHGHLGDPPEAQDVGQHGVPVDSLGELV